MFRFVCVVCDVRDSVQPDIQASYGRVMLTVSLIDCIVEGLGAYGVNCAEICTIIWGLVVEIFTVVAPAVHF